MTTDFAQTSPIKTPRSKRPLLMVLLGLAVLASALSVIYVKDLNRRLLIEQQQLLKAKHSLAIARGQLLLEYSTWAAQPRIQKLAQSQLKMKPPRQTYVIIDHPPPTQHNSASTRD